MNLVRAKWFNFVWFTLGGGGLEINCLSFQSVERSGQD